MRFLIFTFCFLILGYEINAQFEELPMDNKLYVDHIKSITIHNKKTPDSYPFISLNTETLHLGFDDFNTDNDYYYYIVHCDRNWNMSNISTLDYLSGFNGEQIEEYEPSSLTIIDYTHFYLDIPNEDTRLLISGNYMIFIFDQDENPIFSKRFVMYENKLTTAPKNVQMATNLGQLDSGQTIQFSIINAKGKKIDQPLESIECHILQNGRWDDRLTNIKPEYERNDAFYFSNTNQLTMAGYKEFRNFDFRSIEFTSLFVHSIDLYDDKIDILLKRQDNRKHRTYIQDNDNNARTIITNDRFDQAERTSEYANVVFNLMENHKYEDDIYILGSFNDFKPSEAYKMTYNQDRQIYMGSALFKQGYYDYMFGLVDVDGNVDMLEFEGSSNLTENDYQIITYYRAYNQNYDEVVSYKPLNSGDINY